MVIDIQLVKLYAVIHSVRIVVYAGIFTHNISCAVNAPDLADGSVAP